MHNIREGISAPVARKRIEMTPYVQCTKSRAQSKCCRLHIRITLGEVRKKKQNKKQPISLDMVTHTFNEFKSILLYIADSRIVRIAERDPVSQKHPKNPKEERDKKSKH